MSAVTKRKVQSLVKRIHDLKKELEALQKSCDHENVKRTPRANTGNYDPTQDSYWYDIDCKDCGLRWTEDQ